MITEVHGGRFVDCHICKTTIPFPDAAGANAYAVNHGASHGQHRGRSRPMASWKVGLIVFALSAAAVLLIGLLTPDRPTEKIQIPNVVTTYGPRPKEVLPSEVVESKRAVR